MSKPASKATTEQLCTVINEIDCASQSAFSAIAALCRLALASLETSEGVQDIESLANVFNVICDKAMDTENSINAEAEGVGCHYKDLAFSRRGEARRKARMANGGEA